MFSKVVFEKWTYISIKILFSTSRLLLANVKQTNNQNLFTYIAEMHFKFYFTEYQFCGRLLGIDNQRTASSNTSGLLSNHFDSFRNSEILTCKCAEHINRMRYPNCQLK